MGELFVQGLQLTLLGMGMTFASIGALVVGMYLMTAVTRKRRPEVDMEEPEDEGGRVPLDRAVLERGGMSVRGESTQNAKYRAAATAVAVALAEEAQRKAVGAPRRFDDAWDLFVRNRHLSRRMRHDLRQRHR
jgi:Na+-transporting methylmalonyl-CoA/oxaloacetate decarboxylase gamma subunit